MPARCPRKRPGRRERVDVDRVAEVPGGFERRRYLTRRALPARQATQIGRARVSVSEPRLSRRIQAQAHPLQLRSPRGTFGCQRGLGLILTYVGYCTRRNFPDLRGLALRSGCLGSVPRAFGILLLFLRGEGCQHLDLCENLFF